MKLFLLCEFWCHELVCITTTHILRILFATISPRKKLRTPSSTFSNSFTINFSHFINHMPVKLDCSSYLIWGKNTFSLKFYRAESYCALWMVHTQSFNFSIIDKTGNVSLNSELAILDPNKPLPCRAFSNLKSEDVWQTLEQIFSSAKLK